MRLSSLALVFLGLAGCRGWESDQPPVHLVRNMDTQPKGKPYRKDISGLFADGRMMRPPVEGTVAQGQLVQDEVLTSGLGADGQPSAKFPESIKVDDALTAYGRERFQIYCAPCHGVQGDGKGLVAAAPNGLKVPPPSMHDQRIKDLTVGRIYMAIKDGVNVGNMGSYASQIPTAERWAIVAAVRAIQKERDASVSLEGGKNVVVGPITEASADAGALLYTAKGCNACHSLDGTPLAGPTFKGLIGKTEATNAGDVKVDDAYLKESIQNPAAKIVNGFPPIMPPLGLTDLETESLILFIKSKQ